MTEDKAAKVDPLHRDLFRAAEFDQVRKTDGFNGGGAEVGARRRVEVQRGSLFVQKPLAGGVQFFEDILHEAVLIMHPHAAVVLPTALISHFTGIVLSGNYIMEVSPHGTVHGVDETAARVGPPGS